MGGLPKTSQMFPARRRPRESGQGTARRIAPARDQHHFQPRGNIHGEQMKRRPQPNLVVLMVLALSGAAIAPSAHAGWFDHAWAFRRSIDVAWDHQHSSGDDIAQAEFSTAGHNRP